MTDLDEILSTTGPRLRELTSRVLYPLQMSPILDSEAVADLAACVELLAKQLKGHDLLPRSLLYEIRTTVQVLRNEAPYFKGDAAVLEDLANQLEMSFDLILCGECHEDRVPGVPRIM